MSRKKQERIQKRGDARLLRPAIGLEAEFAVIVDGEQRDPKHVFGDPRSFLDMPLMHRTGTSYHVPTGGAVYFDTGVIEVVTPVIELERGCAARAGRSLWEGIHLVRDALDRWSEREGRDVRLVGFSTHYNISLEPGDGAAATGDIRRLAYLLAHVLPPPVMLLAANPRSTGVGVRPRGDRIEITADFTPSPALMIATATVVTAIVRGTLRWPSYELEQLAEHRVPVLSELRPIPHTSRQGWLARFDCYPRNPFATGVDEPCWHTSDAGLQSLRGVARRVVRRFRPDLRAIGDSATLRLIDRILSGRAPSLLEEADRPEPYEDVGRLCSWDDLFPENVLERSRYERVLIRAIAGRRFRHRGRWLTPVGMRGWAQVVFRGDDGARILLSIDHLADRLDQWEEPRPEPRFRPRGWRRPGVRRARRK